MTGVSYQIRQGCSSQNHTHICICALLSHNSFDFHDWHTLWNNRNMSHYKSVGEAKKACVWLGWGKKTIFFGLFCLKVKRIGGELTVTNLTFPRTRESCSFCLLFDLIPFKNVPFSSKVRFTTSTNQEEHLCLPANHRPSFLGKTKTTFWRRLDSSGRIVVYPLLCI